VKPASVGPAKKSRTTGTSATPLPVAGLRIMLCPPPAGSIPS